MTHVPSRKVLKRDLGFHVQRRVWTRTKSEVATRLDNTNKHTKTHAWANKNRCKETKESQTRWHKASKAAHYHTKGKGKHVIKHLKRLRYETLTWKSKQMRVRQAASKPNIMKIYSYTWLYPNKPSNVTNATKQASGPKDHQTINP